mmetsp:Transcript_75154/g.212569  ORF Transcript_75154/g.212569 Transcript_75154/m.212569 type:complete len:225 (+) Transcript_75154:755-1429(+)
MSSTFVTEAPSAGGGPSRSVAFAAGFSAAFPPSCCAGSAVGRAAGSFPGALVAKAIAGCDAVAAKVSCTVLPSLTHCHTPSSGQLSRHSNHSASLWKHPSWVFPSGKQQRDSLQLSYILEQRCPALAQEAAAGPAAGRGPGPGAVGAVRSVVAGRSAGAVAGLEVVARRGLGVVLAFSFGPGHFGSAAEPATAQHQGVRSPAGSQSLTWPGVQLDLHSAQPGSL